MKLSEAQNKFDAIARLVDLQKTYNFNVSNTVFMIHEISGEAETLRDFAKEFNAEMEGKIVTRDFGIKGTTKYDKRIELVGQKHIGRGVHFKRKYEDNPFGVNVGYYDRCKCGKVGILGIKLQRNNKLQTTALVKLWTHENNKSHSEVMHTWRQIFSWKQVLRHKQEVSA